MLYKDRSNWLRLRGDEIHLAAHRAIFAHKPDMLREAVAIAGGKVVLEASGGVNLDTVAAIAETGVDFISVGALTHSAPNLDLGMDVV